MANCHSTTLSLDDETIGIIRDALLIGLASYGEIERLSATQEIRPCEESGSRETGG